MRRRDGLARPPGGIPTSADAFLRLGEAQEKLKDPKSARIAYAKYVELAPDGKEAEAVRRKLAQK